MGKKEEKGTAWRKEEGMRGCIRERGKAEKLYKGSRDMKRGRREG